MIIPFLQVQLTRLSTFQDYPKDFEDAAKIDGASSIQYLTKVILPLSRPIIAGAAVINFTMHGYVLVANDSVYER